MDEPSLDALTNDNPEVCPMCGNEPAFVLCPGDDCDACGEMLLLWQRNRLAERVRSLETALREALAEIEGKA